VSGE
jgi:hypothetical protein